MGLVVMWSSCDNHDAAWNWGGPIAYITHSLSCGQHKQQSWMNGICSMTVSREESIPEGNRDLSPEPKALVSISSDTAKRTKFNQFNKRIQTPFSCINAGIPTILPYNGQSHLTAWIDCMNCAYNPASISLSVSEARPWEVNRVWASRLSYLTLLNRPIEWKFICSTERQPKCPTPLCYWLPQPIAHLTQVFYPNSQAFLCYLGRAACWPASRLRNRVGGKLHR